MPGECHGGREDHIKLHPIELSSRAGNNRFCFWKLLKVFQVSWKLPDTKRWLVLTLQYFRTDLKHLGHLSSLSSACSPLVGQQGKNTWTFSVASTFPSDTQKWYHQTEHAALGCTKSYHFTIEFWQILEYHIQYSDVTSRFSPQETYTQGAKFPHPGKKNHCWVMMWHHFCSFPRSDITLSPDGAPLFPTPHFPPFAKQLPAFVAALGGRFPLIFPKQALAANPLAPTVSSPMEGRCTIASRTGK